ncbi:MAG: class I SAM-dependent methyltransferase [Infirmifilum sp.]
MALSYDLIASIYDELYGPEQLRKNSVVATFVDGTRSIADVGCGTGILGERLHDTDYYLCIDLSEGMLRIFKEKRLNVPSDALEADAEHLPLRDNIFEAVASVTVLHEVPGALEQIHRIAAPGAIVVVSLKKTLKTSIQLNGFTILNLIESGGDEIYAMKVVKQMPFHHVSE